MVDQIVAHVMERLRLQPTVRAESAVETSTQPTTDTLVLSDDVVTAELLEQRMNGKRRVLVATRAVLTPSARDLLRSRNIEWSRRSAAQAENSSTTVWKAVVVSSSPVLEGALDDAAQRAGIRWDREFAGNTPEAVRHAVGELCRAAIGGAVIFTDQPEAAACRANRNNQVRAAVVSSVNQVRATQRDMGPNLFCIAVGDVSYIELRNLLREATTSEPSAPPGGWDE